MNQNKVKVSVLCITYNQEKYIAQTLESIFMQKTNFSYEILVHDDASTDNTQKIAREYEKKFPGVIRPFYEKENQFSLNNKSFLKQMFIDAKGDYIIICEGDDYWTDPLKLQKQVDFLESHKDYGLVFHPVRVFFENNEKEESVFPEISDIKYFSNEELLRNNYMHTNSVLYRRVDYKKLLFEVMPFDWYLHLVHAKDRKIGFINEIMADYRRHADGIWWETTNEARDKVWRRHSGAHVQLYVELLDMYGSTLKYRQIIDAHIEGTINIMSRIDFSDKTHLLDEFAKKFPELCESLFLSLSRTTYKNYKELEVKNELHAKQKAELEAELQEMVYKTNQLAAEKEEIVNSKAYKVGNKLAKVSRKIRRIK